MQVNLQYAQEHLAELGIAVDAGQEVVIARPDKPALRLVVSAVDVPKPLKGKRVLGAGIGELRVPSSAEWKAWDDEIINAPLTTGGDI